jgi:hypothetical protein
MRPVISSAGNSRYVVKGKNTGAAIRNTSGPNE